MVLCNEKVSGSGPSSRRRSRSASSQTDSKGLALAEDEGDRETDRQRLGQRELAHAHVQLGRQIQQIDELITAQLPALGLAAIDPAQKFEGFDHRQFPPQLGALAEDNADPRPPQRRQRPCWFLNFMFTRIIVLSAC